MNRKRELFVLPAPSTSFSKEGYFDSEGSEPAIRYSYLAAGISRDGGIGFSKVAAVRIRAERCCTLWHIEGAYDTLVEVEDSSWVAEIRADTSEQWRDTLEMHHYMLYLDSVGCFEVIAESCTTY